MKSTQVSSIKKEFTLYCDGKLRSTVFTASAVVVASKAIKFGFWCEEKGGKVKEFENEK